MILPTIARSARRRWGQSRKARRASAKATQTPRPYQRWAIQLAGFSLALFMAGAMIALDSMAP
jgi:hypothetical protein